MFKICLRTQSVKGVTPRDEAQGWTDVQVRGLGVQHMHAGCHVRRGSPSQGSVAAYSAETSLWAPGSVVMSWHFKMGSPTSEEPAIAHWVGSVLVPSGKHRARQHWQNPRTYHVKGPPGFPVGALLGQGVRKQPLTNLSRRKVLRLN